MAWRVGKSVRVCGYEWTNNSFCRKHSRSFCLSCMHLYVLLMRIYMCKCTKRREPSVCKVIRLCLAEAATDRRWTVGVWASEFAPFFFAFDVKPCLSGAAKPREVTACWEDEGRKTANEAASSLRILPSLDSCSVHLKRFIWIRTLLPTVHKISWKYVGVKDTACFARAARASVCMHIKETLNTLTPAEARFAQNH